MKRFVMIIAIVGLSIFGYAKGWLPQKHQEVANIINEVNVLDKKLQNDELEKECKEKIKNKCSGFEPMNRMCKMMKSFFSHHRGLSQYKRAIQNYVHCVKNAVRHHNIPHGVLQCQRPELDCSKWLLKKSRHDHHH